MTRYPFCVKEIQDDAVLCRYCGRELSPNTSPPESRSGSTHVSPAVVFVVTLAAIVVFGWMAAAGVFSDGGGASSAGRVVIPEPIGAPPPVVTKYEYNQIVEGMSYSDVVRIIGAQGEELSRSDMAGLSTVMYCWANELRRIEHECDVSK